VSFHIGSVLLVADNIIVFLSGGGAGVHFDSLQRRPLFVRCIYNLFIRRKVLLLSGIGQISFHSPFDQIFTAGGKRINPVLCSVVVYRTS